MPSSPARITATLAAAISAFLVISAAPAVARPDAVVLLDGLSSPKGITVEADQNIAVAQGAFGPPGPVLLYTRHGRDRGEQPATDPVGLIDIASAGDTGWGITSDDPRTLLRADENGAIEPVLNITEYQAAHPDPNDTNGDPQGSNPYGLAALPNGDALVSDAQHNDLLRVTPSGDVTLVARFLPEMISGIPAEAVPTTVTVGPDGFAYVGELKGYPFEPGTSRIWRIDPSADGATCSSAGSADGCSPYASGFTAIQDIAFNSHNGALYVYELAANGVLAFEEGFGTGEFPDAVLLKVHGGRQTELAAGQLSEPGGVAVARDGTVFVTDGLFTGGRLLQVRG
jgi:hypothetical protein